MLFSAQVFQWRGGLGESSFIAVHQIMNNSQRIKGKEICPGILRRKDPQSTVFLNHAPKKEGIEIEESPLPERNRQIQKEPSLALEDAP